MSFPLLAHRCRPAIIAGTAGFGGRIQPISATPSNLSRWEVEHGDVQDTVHGEAEGSTMGTLEEWTKHLSDRPSA
jgi:hypothetical protein